MKREKKNTRREPALGRTEEEEKNLSTAFVVVRSASRTASHPPSILNGAASALFQITVA